MKGKRTRGALLEVRSTAIATTPHRIGIIVPRHSHSAVDRNLVKRRLREIVRTEQLARATSGELVVFALPAAYNASFDRLRDELMKLFRKAGA